MNKYWVSYKLAVLFVAIILLQIVNAWLNVFFGYSRVVGNTIKQLQILYSVDFDRLVNIYTKQYE